jgi:lipoprotein NlpI
VAESRPMRPSFRLRLAGVALCLLATVPLISAASANRAPATAPAGRLAKLKAALAQADRLTIAPQVSSGKAPAPVVLETAALVTEFLDNLEIDEAYGPVRYDTQADAIYTFSRGDKVLVEITQRRLDHLAWKGGAWEGDAVITVASYRKLQQWCQQLGADITAVVRHLGEEEAKQTTEAARRFLQAFTPAAQRVFASSDPVSYTGSQVRRVASPLGRLYANKEELVSAAYRGLAETPGRWLEDDWPAAAVQSALLEVNTAMLQTVLQRLPEDDPGRRGAARFLFRHKILNTMGPAGATLAVRLADFALRTGRNDDKHTVLEYMAGLPGDETAGFLKDIASGKRTYAYATPYDRSAINLEEPGLRFTAALWLAKRGDSSARGLISSLTGQKPYGQDLAALTLAAALLDPKQSIPTTIFKYRSRTLGLAGLEALRQRSEASLTVASLRAVCEHTDREVAHRGAIFAQEHGLQPAAEGGAVASDFEIDPGLAEQSPELAVKEYTQQMEKAQGRTLANLQALRARAYFNQDDYARAEIDYLNAAGTDYPEGAEARQRLPWVRWYLGDNEGAEAAIEAALADQPSAELLLLRGIMRYGQEDFRLPTDSDLVAATVLDPKEGYAPLFQHFAALLSGRADQSRLRSYFLSADGLEDWPATVISFVLGIVPPEQLLQMAAQGEPTEIGWHSCEANFYLSQMARVAGNTEEERRYLTACVATNQPRVAEFWVAKSRLEKLRSVPPADPVRTQRANRI